MDFWHGSWCSVTFAVEDDSISRVSKSVEGGRSQASVREGVAPFFEVEVACDDALTDALSHSEWWMRAAAADILGDIGAPATPSISALTEAMRDDSEWVRRNATEALGTLRAKSAVPALARALSDESDRVRHNAALTLIKIGAPAVVARTGLTQALDDENRYVRALSCLALDMTPG